MTIKSLSTQRFPFHLHEMLSDAEKNGTSNIVSWLPCGKKFKVHKHKDFAKLVMPQYCRHTKYKSFLRQLSMYKFTRINDGALRGAYYHQNFQRDRLDLIQKMNRRERPEPAADQEVNKNKNESWSRSSIPSSLHIKKTKRLEGDSTGRAMFQNPLKDSIGSTLFEIGSVRVYRPLSPNEHIHGDMFFEDSFVATHICNDLSRVPKYGTVDMPEDILDEIINTFMPSNRSVSL